MRRLVLLAALTFGGVAVETMPADACCWGRGCWGGGCCYSSCYSYCGGCYSYCAPCYSYCAPCYSYCAPCYGYAPVAGHVAVASTTAKATLVVSLPAEAKLTIDSTVTKSTSGRRVFVTPELKKGQDYVYTLKAEIMRDGEPVQVTKNVKVRAGQETKIDLEIPVAVTASR